MPLINHKNLGPLIINVDGLNLLSQERALIKHDLIGGIILFAHNFESKSQLKDLIADIKSIKDNILITIDHEGGRVQRLQDGFTNLPSFEKISNNDIASLGLSLFAFIISLFQFNNSSVKNFLCLAHIYFSFGFGVYFFLVLVFFTIFRISRVYV